MPISRRDLLRAGAGAPLALFAPQGGQAATPERIAVQAPFAMPTIIVPRPDRWPAFPITRYGAVPSDRAATRTAIARAIDAAHRAGGGRVVVPAGTWLTGGPAHLRSNVALHLDDGAILSFSPDPADYLPGVPTSWEGIECVNYSPLVYALDCRNVAVTGSGVLRAELDIWQAWYARPQPHMEALVELYQMARRGVPAAQRDMTTGAANLRPHFIQFNRCRNVLIEGVHIENSPFWTIHPYLCRDVVIRRVSIRAHGHNNDGVDPEMSQNVLIEDCVFDQGDDAVSVKSGREFDAWRLATPSRNIVMRRCRVKNGHQLMAIGSELSGGVENVIVDDCHFEYGEARAKTAINNILFIKTNERRGGFVRNIHLSNVSATEIAGGVLSIDTDVLYQWRRLTPTYDRRPPPVTGIHVRDVRVARAAFLCQIKGEAALPVRDVSMRAVRAGHLGGAAVRNRNVAGFSFK